MLQATHTTFSSVKTTANALPQTNEKEGNMHTVDVMIVVLASLSMTNKKKKDHFLETRDHL